MSQCLITNSDLLYKAKGYCRKHYEVYRRNTDPSYIERRKISGLKYRGNNKDKQSKRQQEWRKTNPEKLKAQIKRYNYKRYHNNPQKSIERVMNWRNENPYKVLNNQIKHMTKIADFYNKNMNEYRWANMSWSKLVKKLNNNACIVCGSTGELHAHHIFHKAKYPELSLNINNGLPVCVPCHKEVHGWGLVI